MYFVYLFEFADPDRARTAPTAFSGGSTVYEVLTDQVMPVDIHLPLLANARRLGTPAGTPGVVLREDGLTLLTAMPAAIKHSAVTLASDKPAELRVELARDGLLPEVLQSKRSAARVSVFKVETSHNPERPWASQELEADQPNGASVSYSHATLQWVEEDIDITEQPHEVPVSRYEPRLLAMPATEAWPSRCVFRGFVTGMSPDPVRVLIECKALRSLLKTNGLTRTYARTCNFVLYGAECGVDPALHSAEVGVSIAYPGEPRFAVHEAPVGGDEQWLGGVVEYRRTGPGLVEQVLRSTILEVESNLIRTLTVLPLQVDALVTLFKGCGHTRADCVGRFSNGAFFGGFDKTPQQNPHITMKDAQILERDKAGHL